jgi:hypothetical protein
MEMHYTSYTRKIGDSTFYFVKSFRIFPDMPQVPPLQEGFGMHIEFEKACRIAGILDPVMIQQLLRETREEQPQAKVIRFNNNTGHHQQWVAGL